MWRREVERAGLPGLYLMAVETGWDAGWDATKVGFDAKVLFQPQFSILATVPRLDVPNPRPRVFDYNTAWPVLANPEPVCYRRYDSVCPGWDNTARRGEESWVLHNSNPAAYEEWLRLAVKRALGLDPGETDDDRTAARAALGRALAARGLPRLDFSSVTKFLAATPSRILVVTLEDALGLADQVNVPGTVAEHPNWRRRLPVFLEHLKNESGLISVRDVMVSAGRRGRGVGVFR